MKTLLIDNYDSFTYNLFQLLAEVNGAIPEVVRNDELTWSEIRDRKFDNIVISPGPGSPAKNEDFGVCRDVVAQESIPVLGVCLGHQGLCHFYGGKIDYAPEVMHGRISRVYHGCRDIFDGVPSPFAAVRYHSLIVRDLPDCLETLGWTDDGIVMAVRHRAFPLWGLQFHPESICTEHGRRLLENFRDLTLEFLSHQDRQLRSCNPIKENFSAVGRGATTATVHYRKLDNPPDAETAFLELFGNSQLAFWLDSSQVQSGLGRFSFMGTGDHESGEHVWYDSFSNMLHIRRNGIARRSKESVLSYLSRRTAEMRVAATDAPFPFVGGYVGYLGYELANECVMRKVCRHQATTPDASFLFADRFIAFDHAQQSAYLVRIADSSLADVEPWFDEMENRLHDMSQHGAWRPVDRLCPLKMEMRHDPSAYLARIKECLKEIREGNSYEVCLTNQLNAKGRLDTLNCYRALRSINPAPYSAYLKFPDLAVLCSSPERFLTVDAARWVESKPIKGTLSRGDSQVEDEARKNQLTSSEKDRAENLMIVDLVRNDLGSVCEVGSVGVTKLFAVESYATVHQLVSTIRGRLPVDASAFDCVRAAFPGGSMTGAPKIRTMQIIDGLEGAARGIYSGSLGYFGLDGSADLNIVIRTIVVHGETISVGIGGAIVALSDAEAELDESLLKGRALVDALNMTLPETETSSDAGAD